MSQIEVPDWVVEVAARVVAKNVGEDYDSLGQFTQDTIKATQRECITAALGAWVVPAGYMDAKAEFLLPRPGRCVLSSHTVLVRDAYEGRNLPLYTLRQEKPE